MSEGLQHQAIAAAEAVPHAPRYDAKGILEFFTRLEIPHRVYDHEPIMTVADGTYLYDVMPGMHTRNMFLKDKSGALVLVTLPDRLQIDLKKLAVLLGLKRFSFASADLLYEILGVRPGSVTPLAILNDHAHAVKLVLDQTMMAAEIINVHPMINDQTIGFAPQDFLRLLEKFDIEPHIIDLRHASP